MGDRPTRAVLEVMDKLKKNPAFSDVNLVYIRQAGGSSDDIVYAINFVFGGNAGDRTLNRETGK